MIKRSMENKHLEPVFKILLAGLEKAGIDYWVYGGVSIAACKGEFFRENTDVDIFVKVSDFPRTKSLLNSLCNQNKFNLPKEDCSKKTGRPKLIVKNEKKRKLLEVVPIYLNDNKVEIKSDQGSKIYPIDILERVERNINGYRFFTSQDYYIKKLFLDFLRLRGDKKRVVVDAFAILDISEVEKLCSESCTISK